MIWFDPEGDEAGWILFDEFISEVHRAVEGLSRFDELVCGEHAEDRVGVFLREDRGGERDSVDGVAGLGFTKDVGIIE